MTLFIGTYIAVFLAWFNKSGLDFKVGFKPKRRLIKRMK
tara:strand:+ start:1303 stop:1419 length:117 start_codon:yes stop_codon:yes gene_type:complete